jgi:methionine-rich copper-binding protein CopC
VSGNCLLEPTRDLPTGQGFSPGGARRGGNTLNPYEPFADRDARCCRSILLSALAALALGSDTPAFGHNVVEQRIPAPDSEVSQSPVEVSIATDGSFLDLGGEGRGFAIVVRDSSGQYFGDGCVELTEGRMKASIELGEPGVYELAYQFVSADGHSLAESYEFTYAPADDYRSAPGYAHQNAV